MGDNSNSGEKDEDMFMWGARIKAVTLGDMMPDDMLKSTITKTRDVSANIRIDMITLPKPALCRRR